MHDTSQLGSRNFIFLMINMRPRAVSALDFNTARKGFKQHLIVSRYLRVALIAYPCCDVTKT